MKLISNGRLIAIVAVAIAGAGSNVHAQYTLSTIGAFNNTNGAEPLAGLIADAAGNLYGTTVAGGANNSGTVFEIAAGTHALTTLATFNHTSGENSHAGLIADAAGNLYGTTHDGGANNRGTVFEIAAGTHAIVTLATFIGSNGEYPEAGLIADAAGNLYGTTSDGGAGTKGSIVGFGSVFEIAVGTHALTTLATFFNITTGENPSAGLIADAAGNLYGTTANGGPNGSGTVFEIAAGTHALTTLATFDGTNGAEPLAGLIADAAGNLYGTTYVGGANNQGTVFEIAAGTHALTTLATFIGSNGESPQAGLIADAAGNLYGTTSGGTNNPGTVFEIAAGTHALTTLAAFDGTNGSHPDAGLIADAAGNLYGTTVVGGPGGSGTVFELSPVSWSVGVGANQFATVNGGTSALGGTQIVLPNVTTGGTFTSNYQTATSISSLEAIIGSAAYSSVNFAVGGVSPQGFSAQIWDLHFDGTFTGLATVTLSYDPMQLNGISPADLEIEHYTGGQWVDLHGTVDPAAHTITFQTDSFSPFLLTVPEPSSFALAGFAILVLGIVAVRRRATHLF